MDLNENKRIILALDVLNEKKAFDVLDNVHDLINAVKVNFPLILSCGIEICIEIKKRYGLPIIGDFKIADVSITNNHIIDISIDNKIDFLTVHGFIGKANLVKLKNHAKDKIQFFIITELTSCLGTILLPFEKNAELAVELDFYGIQAPATKPYIIKKLRKRVGSRLKIISCGILAQGAAVGSAIRNGADFEIIGRGIYMMEDPRKATKEYIKHIEINTNYEFR